VRRPRSDGGGRVFNEAFSKRLELGLGELDGVSVANEGNAVLPELVPYVSHWIGDVVRSDAEFCGGISEEVERADHRHT